MRPVNLAAYFTLIKAHLRSSKCKRTHVTMMSHAVHGEFEPEERDYHGRTSLSWSACRLYIKPLIIFHTDLIVLRCLCTDRQNLHRKKAIIAKGVFPCYASHYASSSLSWLYIKALNIFHSNLIVLIGIWKEDVEQGELGTVNFFHQYWIESGKFWLICLIHSSVVSVSSEQCKHVNWLTTHAISKPQITKFYSRTNQALN